MSSHIPSTPRLLSSPPQVSDEYLPESADLAPSHQPAPANRTLRILGAVVFIIGFIAIKVAIRVALH
jgi:hypothetical protein